MDPTHDREIEDLLGAYALDAVDAEESRRVEEHLATCPRCRGELAAHREVAAMLGNAGGDAPPGLWERIAAELDLEGRDVVVPLVPSLRRRRPAERVLPIALGALAAALAIVVGILSTQVTSLNSQVAGIQSALGTGSVAHAAALAAVVPDHRSITLSTASGQKAAVVISLPDGHGYWVTEGQLTQLPSDRSYQLWAAVDGRVVSLGLLGRAPSDVAIEVTRNMTKFMVTVEPLGGTTAPTSAVVAQSPTLS